MFWKKKKQHDASKFVDAGIQPNKTTANNLSGQTNNTTGNLSTSNVFGAQGGELGTVNTTQTNTGNTAQTQQSIVNENVKIEDPVAPQPPQNQIPTPPNSAPAPQQTTPNTQPQNRQAQTLNKAQIVQLEHDIQNKNNGLVSQTLEQAIAPNPQKKSAGVSQNIPAKNIPPKPQQQTQTDSSGGITKKDISSMDALAMELSSKKTNDTINTAINTDTQQEPATTAQTQNVPTAPQTPPTQAVPTQTPSNTNTQINNNDILLKNVGDSNVQQGTPVRDPLFAAKILEQENKAKNEVATNNTNQAQVSGVSSGLNQKIITPQKPTVPDVGAAIPGIGIPGPLTMSTSAGTSVQVHESPFVRRLRTFQSDVAETLKEQKTSVVQMTIKEHEKRQQKAEEASPVSRRNLPLVIVSTILITSSVVLLGVGVFYFVTKDYTAPAPRVLNTAPLIYTEKNDEINITDMSSDKIKEKIHLIVSELDIDIDHIQHIYFTNEEIISEITRAPLRDLISTSDFINALEMKTPTTLRRTLDKKFMFGIHSFNGNQPFIILKTDFFENTFAGMLEWESFLAEDMLSLFSKKDHRNLYDKKFDDIIIKNRDIRALLDSRGDIVLMYSFFDRNTLVITTRKDTLDEIITRLNRPQAR